MATKVLFHCQKGHDLTFNIPPYSRCLEIMKKGATDGGRFDCSDFDNEREEVPNCMHCNNCIATEVHDDN